MYVTFWKKQNCRLGKQMPGMGGVWMIDYKGAWGNFLRQQIVSYLDCSSIYKTASICQNSQNKYANMGEFYNMSVTPE